jgi:DNA-binding CsgD family transcriptional regulator
LREAETKDLLEERCLEYYRTSCLDAADQARYRILEWLDWIELEIDNIRSVLQLCLTRRDPSRGLDIAVSTSYYWITRGTNESIRWLDALLASAGASPRAHVSAYRLRGWLSMMQADPAAARPWLIRAIAMARETGSPTQLSESLSLASTAESMAGDIAAAKSLLSEAEAMTAHIDDFPATIGLLQARTINAILQGDLDTAAIAASEGARLSREAGDLYMLEMMLLNQGVVALMGGDLETSKPQLTEALRIAQQIDDRIAQYYCLDTLSRHAASSGQGRLAARLAGAAARVGSEAGANIIRPSTETVAGARELAVGALGVSAFEAAFEAGQRLDRDQALRLALGESERAVVASDGVETGPLARREVEVARLIAEGLTNKQIGARLFISERTAGTHVRNILNKLGFTSRAQIAGWMASPKS